MLLATLRAKPSATGERTPSHERSRPESASGGTGRGLLESHDGNAYRAVYTVRFAEAVHVLHVFQKESPSRMRTAKADIDLAGNG